MKFLCVSFPKSLTDLKLRKLEMDLEDAMRSEGMTVVGR